MLYMWKCKHRAVHTNTKLKIKYTQDAFIFLYISPLMYIFRFEEKKQNTRKTWTKEKKNAQQQRQQEIWNKYHHIKCRIQILIQLCSVSMYFSSVFFFSYKSCFRIYKTRVNAVRITIELTRCCFFSLYI